MKVKKNDDVRDLSHVFVPKQQATEDVGPWKRCGIIKEFNQ